MSERLSRIVGNVCAWLLLTVFLVWAAINVWMALGCAAKGYESNKSATATATAPVSTGDVGGDVNTFNVAGQAPWGVALLLVGLWMLSKRQRATAVRALDRVVGAIEDRHKHYKPKLVKCCSQAATIKTVKDAIRYGADNRGVVDHSERLIRKRLARLEAKRD